MTNHKPHAVDYTFLTPFHPGGGDDDRFSEADILHSTPPYDSDGDPVHLAFVNGQRVASADGVWTVVQGQYGTLSVMPDGEFGYTWDESNAAVQAMEAGGGSLADHFTFKISDGRGGTDFGYFNIVTEAPTPGTTTVTFEDAKAPNFPDIYKGLSWGLVDDGLPLNLNTSGNHFLYTTPNDPQQRTEITTANLRENVTFNGVDITASSAGPTQYGADITFDGYDSNGNKHSMTVSIPAGSGHFDMTGAEHVSLASLGPINELDIYYSFPGEDPNSHDNSMLLFDDFTINV